MNSLTLPTSEEYAPFYADYIQRAAKSEDVIAALPKQIEEIKNAVGKLNEAQVLFKPAPAEWSIKEVVGHMNDVERIFSYRLLRVARGDATPLPGFEQDDYVRAANYDAYVFADLLQEFEFLRRANILAIKNMSAAAALKRGVASGATVSARGLIYMLVGHAAHHLASLHEKYLPVLK